jgi:hypothetical protein
MTLKGIEVFNVLGQKVMQIEELDSKSGINLSSLLWSLYLLQIRLDGKFIAITLILKCFNAYF